MHALVGSALGTASYVRCLPRARGARRRVAKKPTKGLFTVQGHRAVLAVLEDATNDDDDGDDDHECSGYDSDSDIDGAASALDIIATDGSASDTTS